MTRWQTRGLTETSPDGVTRCHFRLAHRQDEASESETRGGVGARPARTSSNAAMSR
jgi:hypothetical protein